MSKVAQHLVTVVHQKGCNLNKFKKENSTKLNPEIRTNTTVSAAEGDLTARQESNLRGNCLSAEMNMHRKFILKMAFKANMTMGQLQIFKPALDAKGPILPSVGHASNLVSDYVTAIQKEEKDKIRLKTSESYEQFSVTIDGSPIGNDAQAMSIRLVSKKNKRVSDNLLSL